MLASSIWEPVLVGLAFESNPEILGWLYRNLIPAISNDFVVGVRNVTDVEICRCLNPEVEPQRRRALLCNSNLEMFAQHQLMFHSAVFAAAIMSKTTVPSRNLISSFSRTLRNRKAPFLAAQCHKLSTIAFPTVPRSQQCLHCTPKPNSPLRQFSSSTPRTYKTVQEQRSRYRSGVRLSYHTRLSPS
jgi:hypothetical protein